MGISYPELVERAAALPNPLKLGGSRLVVHIQTSEAAVDDLIALIRELAEEKKQAGFVAPAEEPSTSLYSNVYVRAVKKQ